MDDIIFRATSEHFCEEFATLIKNEFEMSMMGVLNLLLGLKIRKTSDATSICQGKYSNDLLKKFHMVDSKTIGTPMGINSKMGTDETDPLVNKTMYSGIIGSLLYLTASNPETLFSVGMCARFQVSLRESYLKENKTILRYLKKKEDLFLFYRAGISLN